MASTIFFFLLLLTTATATATTHKTAELNSIIDALITAGDFSNWAKLLSTSNLSSAHLSATVFLPLSYSGDRPVIVPRRLTFSQLRLFPAGARLPTVVPGATLLITNNSSGNFTVDGGATVTKPDMFVNDVVCIHGVEGGFLGRRGRNSTMVGPALEVSAAPGAKRKPSPSYVDGQPRIIVKNGVSMSFSRVEVAMVVVVLMVVLVGNF